MVIQIKPMITCGMHAFGHCSSINKEWLLQLEQIVFVLGWMYIWSTISPYNCVCVSVCVCACTVCARMRVLNITHVCRCMSVEEARAGKRGRECESEIYTYISFMFYFIVILNVPSWVLSPCVMGKFSFLCFVYWWLIKIWLINYIPVSI